MTKALADCLRNQTITDTKAGLLMLRALSELNGYAIEASDGLIGHIEQVYMDDDKWVIRYFVVKTGGWLDTREVLLSPISLGELHAKARTLSVRLTKDKVKNGPSIDLHKPVSRQQEVQFNDYYGWSPYWGGLGLWSRWGLPTMMAMPPHPNDHHQVMRQAGDHHLRSSREVVGYHLHAIDDQVGHVDDFIIDDETWAIRYMVVNTSNWGFGGKVLLAPDWIASVRADERIVEVLVTRDAITHCPEWDAGMPITGAYEARLLEYYRQRQAWLKDPHASAAVATPHDPRTP